MNIIYKKGDLIVARKSHLHKLTPGKIYTVLNTSINKEFVRVICDNNQIDGYAPDYWFMPMPATKLHKVFYE